MVLSGKQRARLRSMAQQMQPILQIGKDGLTENVVRQADEALEARELIKGTTLQNCGISAREACDALCRRTGAQPVGVTGRRFVLYRESEHNKKIEW